MNKIAIKKLMSPLYKIKYRLHSNGWIYIVNHTKIVNPKHLHLEGGESNCSILFNMPTWRCIY